ncbi:unnamed protein product, partial [Didymodactylos carnosus]
IHQLSEILEAFCLYNPSLGYCQGMNFIVGIALLFLEPENAFWLLIAVTECYFPSNYYDSGLIGAQVDQFVLKDLIQIKAPELYRHFESIEVEITSLTLNWFMAIFIGSVPFETLLRIWDCFLLEGPKVLFRFAVAILIMNRDSILMKSDTISMMKHIKESAKNLTDVESLFKIAFEDLKPFTRRKDIAVKQAYYTKLLTEKILKRRLSPHAFAKQDYVFQEISHYTCTLDCVCVITGGLLWFVFGSQFEYRIFEVNIERGIMIDLELTVCIIQQRTIRITLNYFQYNSRAYCMDCVKSDLVLVGTLSGTLLGYSIENRNIQWVTKLSSSIVYITHYKKEDLIRAYCGLSEGTLAIVELSDNRVPEEAFSISLGKAPLTTVIVSNEKLWCICSNKLSILNEKTLDVLISVGLTTQYLELTPILYLDEPNYIWLILRSSNTLQVWDSNNCKLYASTSLTTVFNKLEKPNSDHELARAQTDDEDCTSSETQISSLLVNGGQLWLGTSAGNIYVFDVNFQPKKSKSSIMDFQTDSLYYHSRSFSASSNLIDMSRHLVQHTDCMNNTLFLDKRSAPRSYSESAINIDEYGNDFVINNDYDEWLPSKHLYQIAFSPNVLVPSSNGKTKSIKANFLRRRTRHLSTSIMAKQGKTDHRRFSNLNSEIKLKPSLRKHNHKQPKCVPDSDTSTTLTSQHTRSSSPAIISADECIKHTHRSLSQSIIRNQKSIDTSRMSVNFNLAFKAKVSDSSIKCICKSSHNDQTVIITGQGKYGDDETVLRWKRVEDTTQWTNDVIVELSPDSSIPLRPQHARWKYFKENRDRSNSISSNLI